MQNYLQPLLQSFEENRNQEKAACMKQYLRGKFEFYGILQKERTSLFRKFLKEYGAPKSEDTEKMVKYLWNQPQRELQYVAIDYVVKEIDNYPLEFYQLIEFMVLNKSWWDSVDNIATRIAGPYFLRYPLFKLIFSKKWIESENLWLQRVAILFQLKYKQKTNPILFFNNISGQIDSQEFFIQKAIGWALREYSKTEPEKVENFISQTQLSALSKREALKFLNKK